MKARFSDEQFVAMIKEQEAGEKTVDVCRRHGISSATFYKYKSKYGGMEPSDAKRLRALEDENGKLKKLLAEHMLDNAMLRDINANKVTPVAKRNAVVRWCEAHGVSQRRACDVSKVDRSSVRYLSLRGDDAELRDAIKRVSQDRRRFGCRGVHVMIARKGFTVNHKKVRRIYTEERLQVRRRGGRKRALGTRKPKVLPDGPNQRWSLDFVSDTFGAARKFRILAVNDDCCRENLCLMADTSISGARVARELDALVRIYGKPASIVGDNVLYAERLADLASGHCRVGHSRHA